MKLAVKDKAVGPVQLLSFHVDVELCGLFVALYKYGCKNACWIVPKDLTEIAKDFGLLCDASTNDSNPPSAPISGKTTSLIAILGLGGWLLYRWLKSKRAPKYSKLKSLADYNEGIRARFSLFGRPSHVKSSYFGPKNPPEYKEDNKNRSFNNRSTRARNSARDMMSSDSDWSPIHVKEHKRKLRKRMCRGWPLVYRRGYNYDDWTYSRESAEQSIGSSPAHSHLLRREESLDSISSDFSMASADIGSNIDSNVTAKMDQLQQEIEQLKSSCMSMDEEFETIKTNRNLPGLANLMGSNDSDELETKESAKACFKGLYSLTTINRSMSFDMSMSQCDSIDEDLAFNILSPTGESSLEWDALDSRDLSDNCEPMNFETTGDDYDHARSNNINQLNRGLVGPFLPLSSYCEETAHSLIPQHIMKSILDLSNKENSYIGFVYEDSSNLLRSTLFTMLCKNIPLPSSSVATAVIKEAYHKNPSLFHCWNFNGLNCYAMNKLKGINSCLNSLDKLVSGVRSGEGVLDRLMARINTDPILDCHTIEAVKLHILAKIFACDSVVDSFYKQFCPLLSKDLSASDRIEILINFTDGINSPEDNGSIIGRSDEAIIYLISQTFGIQIQVLKPSAFSTQKYFQKYPEVAPDNWSTVILLSEDNKHFQIVI